jgi:ADP-heptose:LPS heptosyltransferase
MKKILIFNPFGIGDVLFTTPLIRNLKENFKNISLVYLCNRRTYPLLKNNVFLDKVWVFEKDEWRELAKKSKKLFLEELIVFFKKIKKEKFDCLFDFSLNAQYGFFFKLTRIRTRIGFDFKKRGRFLTHKIELPFGYKDKHVAYYYSELLKFLGISAKNYKFDLFLPKDYLEEKKKLI